MEAFRELGITCVHKRIAELEEREHYDDRGDRLFRVTITRHREKTARGATVTRYKLAR